MKKHKILKIQNDSKRLKNKIQNLRSSLPPPFLWAAARTAGSRLLLYLRAVDRRRPDRERSCRNLFPLSGEPRTVGLCPKEVATGAAVKIERFVHEIHNTLKGATKSREIAPKGLTTEFRFELEKLLLIAPAVTEALALDEKGAIRVQASRLRTVLPEAKRDLANAPPFLTAKQR